MQIAIMNAPQPVVTGSQKDKRAAILLIPGTWAVVMPIALLAKRYAQEDQDQILRP